MMFLISIPTFSCSLSQCTPSLPQSYTNHHIDGLVQERRNSTANALELRLSCSNHRYEDWFQIVCLIVECPNLCLTVYMSIWLQFQHITLQITNNSICIYINMWLTLDHGFQDQVHDKISPYTAYIDANHDQLPFHYRYHITLVG